MNMIKELKQHKNGTIKKQVILTGIMLFPLQIGIPAIYLYHGKRCQTTKVLRILDEAPGYAMFETQCFLYTIRSDHPAQKQRFAA